MHPTPFQKHGQQQLQTTLSFSNVALPFQTVALPTIAIALSTGVNRPRPGNTLAVSRPAFASNSSRVSELGTTSTRTNICVPKKIDSSSWVSHLTHQSL